MPETQPVKFLDQFRHFLRIKHYSPQTQKTYVYWVRRFILFSNKQHPSKLGAPEVQAFLEYLAVKRRIAPSTQNQAFNALILLYGKFLKMPLGDLSRTLRARSRNKRLPKVLTREQIQQFFHATPNPQKLMLQIMYGSGLRILECCRLRIKDIDFEYERILIHDGKGFKNRMTLLPKGLVPAINKQIDKVKQRHQKDLGNGHGRTTLPYALSRKYPNLDRSFGWQYLFPSSTLAWDK